MAREEKVEFKEGMVVGRGIDMISHEMAGWSIEDPELATMQEASGQEPRGSMSRVTDRQSLQESLQANLSVSAQYGLFEGSARAQFLSQTEVNTESDLLMVTMSVGNAMKVAKRPKLTKAASDLIADGKWDRFREQYGDGVITGVQTGGELIVLISVYNSNQKKQTDFSAELHASYGAPLASVDVDASMSLSKKAKSENTSLQCSFFQRGGVGETSSMVMNFEDAIKRMKAFTSIVRDNPVAYSVLASKYTILDLPPQPSKFDIAVARDAVEELQQQYNKIRTLISNTRLYCERSNDFVDAPPVAELKQWESHLTSKLKEVITKARAVNAHPYTVSPDDYVVTDPYGPFHLLTRKAGVPEPEPAPQPTPTGPRPKWLREEMIRVQPSASVLAAMRVR